MKRAIALFPVQGGLDMYNLLPHQPTWMGRLVERKLEEVASNPKKKKKARRAATRLLHLKRFLDLIRCW